MNLVSKTSSFPDAPISKEGSIWQPANYLFANGYDYSTASWGCKADMLSKDLIFMSTCRKCTRKCSLIMTA